MLMLTPHGNQSHDLHSDQLTNFNMKKPWHEKGRQWRNK